MFPRLLGVPGHAPPEKLFLNDANWCILEYNLLKCSLNNIFFVNYLIYKNNIIITHSERALFNLNACVEARGTIVPKAVDRGYYGPERRHKGI